MRLTGSFLLIISILFVSCQSGFEKIRQSNDPERILAESLKYYEKEEYLRAQTLMELILNQYRGTRQGEELFFKYAYTHYQLGSYQLAATYFTNFAITYTYSPFLEEAEFMAAYSNYKQSPSYRLDQAPSESAIDAFQDFVDKHPESERVAECNRLIDELRAKLEEKAFAQGDLYFNLGQYQAAITSFEHLLVEYPDSDKAEDVRWLVIRSAFLYAQNSVYDKRGERYTLALEKAQDYLQKHPKGQHRKQATDLRKQIQQELKTYGK